MTVSKQAVVFGAALVLACLACESSNPPPQSQTYGQVGLALVATSDGATFELPAGAQLDLNSGQFDLIQHLDGNTPQIDVAVPPGSYTATLFDQNFETPTTWTLNQIDNAGNVIGAVTATLLTPMPVSLVVTPNQTTQLGLAFSIPTGGTINFARGTVAVTVSFMQQQAQSFAFDTSVPLFVSSSSVRSGSPLGGVVPNGVGLSVELGGPITGSWVELGGETGDATNSFSVCAPPSITTRNATGFPALTDFIAEAGSGNDPISLFGPASICILDDGVQNIVRVRLSHVGAPTTPTYSVLGPGPFQFRFILQAVLPHRAYNYAGHALDLSQLITDSSNGLSLAPTSAAIFDVVNGNITSLELRALFSLNGAGVTFSFTGQ
jgi:hypothetical protein